METNKLTRNEWRYEVINKDGVNYKEGDVLIFNPEYFYPLFMQAYNSDKNRTIENADKIVKCVNSHNELVNIAKRTIFMFSNEANYPYGTQGYLLAMDAKAVLKKVTDTEPIKQ